MTDSELIGLIEAQASLMRAVATGGPQIKSVNDEYTERRELIRHALKERGLSDPNDFYDLWAWYGRWGDGTLPRYQDRRVFITSLYADTIRSITEGRGAPTNIEPTGWERVDREIAQMRQHLTAASQEVEYAAVGHSGREVLISLAQAVFDPEVHSALDGVVPSETDAKRMLEAVILHTMPGGSYEEMRKSVRSVVDAAVALQHMRSASRREAEVCYELTVAMVRVLGRLSAKVD